ncbi:MAG: DUF1127 domain-containing protein [Variibacter sp.]|nr:DUF1127 domain-containing protein [Variibacter sp.]
MTTQSLSFPAASAFGRIVAFAGTVAARAVAFAQAYRSRRDLQLLAGFDDRMLRDIGLTRGDLRDAVAEPLWRDPTNVLVRRARDRRRNAHAVRVIEGAGGCTAAAPTALQAPPLAPEIEAYSVSRFPARSRYY